MNSEEEAKVIRVLTTNERVFCMAIDSLLRQGGNSMTATALFRSLQRLEFGSADFHDQLSQFTREFSQGDPTVLIGFDDGRWENIPEGDTDDEADSEGDSSVYHLRLIYSSEDASFYLFHAGSRVLEVQGVTGGARKREGAVHHVRVELSHPRYLQQVLSRARECPHLIRVEESTEADFWAAASQNPGY